MEGSHTCACACTCTYTALLLAAGFPAANPAAPVVLDWSNVSGLINIYEDSMLVLEGVLSESELLGPTWASSLLGCLAACCKCLAACLAGFCPQLGGWTSATP